MGYTPVAMANPPKPMGTSKILREALTLSTKNARLSHPILLISILSSFLLFVGNDLAIRPLLVDLMLKFTSMRIYKRDSPEFSNALATIQKDVKKLAAEEVIFFILAFFIQSLLQITMIHAITTTYAGELLTLKELLSKLKRGLKGPMITKVYAALVNLGYLLIVLTLVVVSVFMLDVSIALVILGLFLVLLALVFIPYLATVLSLSVVISVAEEDCYGVDAIGRAVKLIKGRKKQAILIVLLCSVLVFGFGEARRRVAASYPLSTAVQAVAGFVYVSLVGVLTFFSLSAFTVLYDECRRGHGETTIAVAGGYAYTGLSATAAHVDKELP